MTIHLLCIMRSTKEMLPNAYNSFRELLIYRDVHSYSKKYIPTENILQKHWYVHKCTYIMSILRSTSMKYLTHISCTFVCRYNIHAPYLNTILAEVFAINEKKWQIPTQHYGDIASHSRGRDKQNLTYM